MEGSKRRVGQLLNSHRLRWPWRSPEAGCWDTCSLGTGRSVSTLSPVSFTSKARLSRAGAPSYFGFPQPRKTESGPSGPQNPWAGSEHAAEVWGPDWGGCGRLGVARRGNISLPFLSHSKHCVPRSPEETIYRQVFLIFYRICSTPKIQPCCQQNTGSCVRRRGKVWDWPPRKRWVRSQTRKS